MKLIAALVVLLAINYANCLTCLSTLLSVTGTAGSTTSTGPATCSTGAQYCYKVTSGFTASASTTVGQVGVLYGPSATSQAFAVNDKGCVPVFTALATAGTLGGTTVIAGQAQTTALPMTLGVQNGVSTLGALLADQAALQTSLCTTNGVCCTTTNCNPATKTVFNPVNLALTLVFSLISYVAIC